MCIKNLLSVFEGALTLVICKVKQHRITGSPLNNTANNSNSSCVCPELLGTRLKQSMSEYSHRHLGLGDFMAEKDEIVQNKRNLVSGGFVINLYVASNAPGMESLSE